MLQVIVAAETDADCIASIHLAAFDSNPLLHAQFPTPSSLEGLHAALSQDVLNTIRNREGCGTIVLVVRDTEADGQIISFAKWDLPGKPKDIVHSDITWPEDCRQEYLDEYHEKAGSAKNRIIGNKPCYRKNCISLCFHSIFFVTVPDITCCTLWRRVSAHSHDRMALHLEKDANLRCVETRLQHVQISLSSGLSRSMRVVEPQLC